ncbi:hypothetical protein CWI42_090980 [Ordospora colligata]|uniref:Uncharacterized protein n=1 Tax=Ordospora colligata OC4 TaxID=1354746 RepID=A0A0B2UDN5_9MICR|nr:uncharacterized protein M896_090990 [Ordospora colligata OC4]KHN69171.1 hypothetical protein M896_090990 [Ordospora colligata OC4]TBU14626.1 hypothetical protein CWI41_090980 [Ordospora colligata]TBU14820.1 hypothetical protein CWI40_090990 [Ordospora colligata]TBU18143.1 hypothetical protein CWI42_090980 [Ordospora colligata]
MELLQEFVDEWKQHVCRVKESLIVNEKKNVKDEIKKVSKQSREADEKENVAIDDNQCEGEIDGVFDRESLDASCIPVIKSKAHNEFDKICELDTCTKKRSKAVEDQWDIENSQVRSIKETREGMSRFGYRDGIVMNKGNDRYGNSKLRKPSDCGYVAELKSLGTSCAKSNKRTIDENRSEVKHDTTKEKKVSDGGDNMKLNAALQLMKRKYMNKVNESICIPKESEFKEEQLIRDGMTMPNVMNKYDEMGSDDGKKRDIKGLNGSNLYKKVIDNQLLKSVPVKEKHGDKKSKTYIPKVGDDDAITDLNFVIPEFAKDPAINFKVKMQDHGVLERYFSNGHEIDVEVLFPHVKNVSNDSPNKWPSQRNGP